MILCAFDKYWWTDGHAQKSLLHYNPQEEQQAKKYDLTSTVFLASQEHAGHIILNEDTQTIKCQSSLIVNGTHVVRKMCLYLLNRRQM